MIEEINKKKKELNKVNKQIKNLKRKEELFNDQFEKRIRTFPEYKEERELEKWMNHHEMMFLNYADKKEEKFRELIINNQDKIPEFNELQKIQEKEKQLCEQRDILNNELAELEKNTEQTQ